MSVDEALAYYEEKCKRYPNADWLYHVAVLKKEKRDWPGSTKAFSQALVLRPNNVKILNDFGMLLYELGKHDQAYTLISRAMSVDPNNHLCKNNMAVLESRRGRYKRGLKVAKKAVHLAPCNAKLQRNIAMVYDATGNVRRAAQHNRTSLQLDPYNSQACRRTGVQLVRMGLTKSEDAHGHYDQYRALEGKKYQVVTTVRTEEMITKLKAMASSSMG